MKNWGFRLILLALLLGVGWWGWGVLFPAPEKVIRKRLAELAQVASVPANEPPGAQFFAAQKLVGFLTPDAEVVLDVRGYTQQTLAGRDDLFKAAMAARNLVGGLEIKFIDIGVNVGLDRESAEAILTAWGRTPADRDFLVQEMKFAFRKNGRNWLVSRVETVKTLR